MGRYKFYLPEGEERNKIQKNEWIMKPVLKLSWNLILFVLNILYKYV